MTPEDERNLMQFVDQAKIMMTKSAESTERLTEVVRTLSESIQHLHERVSKLEQASGHTLR